jgi:hypothetical protein
MLEIPRSRRGIVLVSFAFLFSALVAGCQQAGAPETSEPVTTAPAHSDHPADDPRLAPVDIQMARDLATLDQLCWSIRIESNLEMPTDNTNLIVRYDTGGVASEGEEFRGQTAREVFRAAVEAIEGQARPDNSRTISEAQILELSDALVEIKRRCWFVHAEKTSSEWSVEVKELRAGSLRGTSARTTSPSLVGVFEDLLGQLNRAAESTRQ